MKKCTKCQIVKSIEEFYSKRQSWCKVCTLELRNTAGRNKQYKKRYGITIDDYNELLKNQNNCCAICKTHISKLSKNLAVDHCHETKIIRGLLCFNCNSGIGRFKDKIEFLSEAIKYLEPFIDKEHT
jgi:hypothetical protein